MMKYKLAVTALCALLSMGAHAQSATAVSGAQAGAASQSAAGSVAGAQANTNGNAQNISFTNNVPEVQNHNSTSTATLNENVKYEATSRVISEGTTKQRVYAAPSVVVSGPASGPCNGFSGGIGVAGMGFGIGANMSKVDEGCEDRETARMLGLLGRVDMAVEIIASSEAWQRHLARKKLNPMAAVPMGPTTALTTEPGTAVGVPVAMEAAAPAKEADHGSLPTSAATAVIVGAIK